MKSKFLFAAAIIFVAFTSCKKGEAKSDGSASGSGEKKIFSVEVTASAEKDDDFAVYYTEDGTIDFGGESVVWGGIKGGQADPQTVVFTLPEDVVPTHIRLDFGLKKGPEQGDVTLHNVKMNYYGKSFEIKGSDFLKYLENREVKTEIDTAHQALRIPKNPASGKTPFFYPTQLLVDEVAKITK